MTPDEVIKAIEYYELNVMAPTGSGVREQSRWYACTSDRTRYGFGATASEAVIAATTYEAPVEPQETQEES